MATYPYFSAGLVCPNGVTAHGGICYTFHSDKKTWYDARSWCKTTKGADLLIVRNDDVFNDIKRHISQNPGIFLGISFTIKSLTPVIMFSHKAWYTNTG